MGWQDDDVVAKPSPAQSASSWQGDEVVQETPKQKERTWYDELGRQAALTARAAVTGAMAVPNMIGDVANTGINLGISGINRIAGTNIPILRMPSQATQNLMTRAGVAQPETGTERVVQDIGAGMVGGGTTSKLSDLISRAATSPVARGVFSNLAQGPVMQAVSGGTGAGAAGITREAGGGTGAQTLAGLVGAVAPGGVTAGIPLAARTVLRGSEANLPQIAERTAAFQNAGATSPSVGQVTGNRTSQALESMLSKVPGGAGPMSRAAEVQAAEIGARATKVADDLSKIGDPANAGRAIEKGISGEGGFVSRFKQAQNALYNKVDQFIPKQAPVDVSNTKAMLSKLNEDIQNSPALSKWFKNAKIQGIEEALLSDTSLGLKAPEWSTQRPVFGRVEKSGSDLMGNPQYEGVRSGTMTSQGATIAGNVPMKTDLMGRSIPIGGMATPDIQIPGSQVPIYRQSQMRTNLMGENVPQNPVIGQRTVSAPTKTVSAFSGVGVTPEKSSALPYEAVKKLRSLVGAELEDSGLTSDVPRSKWKAMYAALSSDLDKAAASTGNPEAVKAAARANRFTRAGHARIDDVLDSVVAKKTPEEIYKAATNPSNMEAGATKIASVMKSLEPAERDIVKSAFIRRMGRATAGAQNAQGDVFSSQTFLTNWNKMSPQSKAVMFSGKEGETAAALNDIAKASQYIKEGSKVFANPSQTSHGVAQIGAVTGVASALATGHVGTAALLLGGVGSANLSAKLMTNPVFVKWLSQATKVSPGMLPATISSLGKAMQNQDDDVQNDAQMYSDAIIGSIKNAPGNSQTLSDQIRNSQVQQQ